MAERLLTQSGVSYGSLCLCSRDLCRRAWAADTTLGGAYCSPCTKGRLCFLPGDVWPPWRLRGSRAFPGRQCSGKGLWSESLRFQILGPSRPGRITLGTSLRVLYCITLGCVCVSGSQQTLGAIHTEHNADGVPFSLGHDGTESLYLRVHLLSFV